MMYLKKIKAMENIIKLHIHGILGMWEKIKLERWLGKDGWSSKKVEIKFEDK